MAMLLYIVGLLAFAAGAIALGFGFEIELSFGNSLIVAGTSAAVGGLIVIGLGAVVSQLQRIAEGQNARMPLRPSRVPEMFEPPGAPRAAGVPFPPKPRAGTPRPVAPSEPPVSEPAPAAVPAEDHFAAPPELGNPDMPPLEVEEEVSLSPSEPAAPPISAEPAEAPPSRPRFSFGGLGGRRSEPEWPPAPQEIAPSEEPPPLPRAPTTNFDSMWPAPERKASADLGRAQGKPEPKPEPSFAAGPEPGHPAEPEMPPGTAGEMHAVAILKSGVVDGMGYTLYVDGSIEAELPQGTLRFASINDLRDYLEKNAHH